MLKRLASLSMTLIISLCTFREGVFAVALDELTTKNVSILEEKSSDSKQESEISNNNNPDSKKLQKSLNAIKAKEKRR